MGCYELYNYINHLFVDFMVQSLLRNYMMNQWNVGNISIDTGNISLSNMTGKLIWYWYRNRINHRNQMRHITNINEYYLFPLFKTENNGLLPSRLYLLHKMNMSHSVK